MIAVRLYTGPGYAPINGWLREVANLPKEPPHENAAWGAWNEARGKMADDGEDARRAAATDAATSFGATVGHLVSAVRAIAAAACAMSMSMCHVPCAMCHVHVHVHVRVHVPAPMRMRMCMCTRMCMCMCMRAWGGLRACLLQCVRA